MSFSFGFGDDGRESDGRADESSTANSQPNQFGFIAQQSGLYPPKLHSHTDLLATLPSRIYFTNKILHLEKELKVQLPQRDVHDIQAQLMAEDNEMYAGGFKTWECAVDLATYVLSETTLDKGYESGLNIIELGAGTALPSLSLFQQWLRHSQTRKSKLNIILADYNQSVLELATVPNLFLTWYALVYPQASSQEVEVTPALQTEYLNDLKARDIEVSAISGGWSPEFSALLSSVISPTGQAKSLILASETIYAPASLHAFTSCILEILRNANGQQKARALVASKHIYFGVGGGVDDFLEVLRELDGQGEIIWQTEGIGVSRGILEIQGCRS